MRVMKAINDFLVELMMEAPLAMALLFVVFLVGTFALAIRHDEAVFSRPDCRCPAAQPLRPEAP